jgi:hypothetical protein
VVIDTARAPRSTYRAWSARTGGRVVSVYDWGREIDDLYRTRDLLELGMGRLLDRDGIDWWDVCSLMLSPDLQQLMLGRRVARDLDPNCELHATRDSAFVRGMQALLGVRAKIHRHGSAIDTLRSALHAVQTLDRGELFQVLQDKFDGGHRLRSWFARHPYGNGKPIILCPSAYSNVSRAVANYAGSCPQKDFYMVLARRNARISALPPNVRVASLDGYFVSSNSSELRSRLHEWAHLRRRLVASSEEYLMADSAGVLGRIASLLRWGIAVRDAWSGVFQIENVVECFCSDDSNPYTRIPLLLAKKRRLPTIACHHGALDFRLAFKRSHADVHFVKTEMEWDYTVSVCKLPAQQVVLKSCEGKPAVRTPALCDSKPGYLTFFTEAYHSAGFREVEIFSELMPKLLFASQKLGLQLALKLHPFDGVKKMKSCLRAALSEPDRKLVQVWSGAMSDERWRSTHVMLTGQSSVALEGVEKGIPTFLCRWLSDPFSGYQKQFVRYGIGKLLGSVEEILNIPEALTAPSLSSLGPDISSSVPGAAVAFEEYSTRIMGAGV